MLNPEPGFRPAPASRRPRVLIVGLDGVRWDIAAEDSVAPALQRLAADGAFHTMTMEVPTISAPGWASLLTGTTHAEHGLVDNSCVGGRTWNCPDVLSQCFYQDQSTRTYAAAGWPVLTDPNGLGPIIHPRVEQQKAGLHRIVSRDGETYGYRTIDAELTDFTLAALKGGTFDVGFTYCCDVDDAGHVHGLTGPEYREALGRVDAHTQRLAAALTQRHLQFQEDWLLIVTTDHGHIDAGGHGGDSPKETQSWAITWSPSGHTPEWEEHLQPESLAGRILAHRDS
ncbi:alkaline phosphatase family protein [Corynebacterium confusum]|uniref:alkaline phosphatase family protein n=1 Tax=Corynebacterium confusum TaxID=71254 RepID=UPI0025B5DE74|nr:alkaline phosphatase family protein [Corynebacterium confusum]WJY88837.1 Type I phosphodiesterase / nucleotide pyrophosphatase [Corynebacterium confusum]